MALTLPQDKNEWIEAMHMVAQNTAVAHLGITIADVGEDFIELHMPITDKTRQPLGFLHGGVSMVLAETAASFHATWGIDLNEKVPLGLEINGSHLKAARDGSVKAVAKVVRRSRSLIVHQIDIYQIENDTHIATARVTNYYKPQNNNS